MRSIKGHAAWLGLALGAALFAVVLAFAGIGDVLGVLSEAGLGLLAVAGVHLIVITLDTASWWTLLPNHARPGFARLAALWWVGAAVNALLPVAHVGGELVRARLLTRTATGATGAIAGASVVGSLTIAVLTLIPFAAIGAVLLGHVAPLSGGAGGAIAVGLAALGIMIGGFYWAQQNGLFLRLA